MTPPPEAAEAPAAPLPMAPSGPCWVCGGTSLERVYRDVLDLSGPYHAQFGPYAHADHPPLWIVRCRGCGFGQPESMPATDDFFDRAYDQPWWAHETLDQIFDDGFKDAIFRGVLAELGRRLRPGSPRTLLDVGTLVGRFLHLAREAGWQAEGVETNPIPAEYAERRTGLRVHRLRAQDLADRGLRFGAVVMTDVLEHIPRPAPVVETLRTLLEPGGVVAIKVPHGPAQRLKERIRGLACRTPEARRARHVGVATNYIHVNHFTVGSLRACLERAGFREVEVRVGAPEFLPPSPTRTRRQAAQAAVRNAVYRLAGALPGGARSPLAMNLQAFAVNPG